ncbi:MAG: galactosyltransferase-related protein [bacterium]
MSEALPTDEAYYARFARAPVVELPPGPRTLPRVPFAVIVPYRDDVTGLRAAHLARFVAEVGPPVVEAGGEILIIEQSQDDRRFNRGRLLNVGARLAAERGAEVVILHDVDLLPDARIFDLYGRSLPHPIHLAAHWPKYAHLDLFFGGVTSFTVEQFTRLNGYPNAFWGWGGEDEELYYRLVDAGLSVARPAVGGHTELHHALTQAQPEAVNTRRFEQLERRVPGGRGNGLAEMHVHHLGALTSLAPGVSQATVELEAPASTAGRAARPSHACARLTDRRPSARSTPGRSITFYLNVFRDAGLLDDCLSSIRAAYPDAPVLVRSDGDDDPRIATIADRHRARFVDDINRYGLTHGGDYVQVMFERFLEAPTDWLFKIDPDTRVHRPFRALPDGCRVFGTLQRQRPIYSVQGGCIGFTRAAVEHFVERCTFRDPRLARDPPPYLTSSAHLGEHLARVHRGGLGHRMGLLRDRRRDGGLARDPQQWRITPDNADCAMPSPTRTSRSATTSMPSSARCGSSKQRRRMGPKPRSEPHTSL